MTVGPLKPQLLLWGNSEHSNENTPTNNKIKNAARNLSPEKGPSEPSSMAMKKVSSHAAFTPSLKKSLDPIIKDFIKEGFSEDQATLIANQIGEVAPGFNISNYSSMIKDSMKRGLTLEQGISEANTFY